MPPFQLGVVCFKSFRVSASHVVLGCVGRLECGRLLQSAFRPDVARIDIQIPLLEGTPIS